MTAESPGSVLVVGAGAIGVSWAALFLAHRWRVALVDPDPAARDAALRRAPALAAELRGGVDAEGGSEAGTRGGSEAGGEAALGELSAVEGIAAAVAGVGLVVECGPERLALKRELFAELDRLTPEQVLLTSSSSGLPPSLVQQACARHPERFLVAHPFHPPHLVPLVELVGGARTDPAALDAADRVFTGVGKRVIRVHGERPGHVVNRLQAALWREAYHLVATGAVSVADVDTALAWGPGLRWALLGPFLTQHLSGGPGGIEHVLAHLGPPMAEWWADLGTPELTPGVVRAVVEGVAEALGDTDAEQLRARRDTALRELLRLKEAGGLP